MYHIDSIEPLENAARVSGWIVDGSNSVTSATFRQGQKDISLEGFGKPSPDLVGPFGAEQTHSRFSVIVPATEPDGFLIFGLSDARQVYIPLGANTDALRLVEPLIHQIYEGRYIGRYRILAPDTVAALSLSESSPDAEDAISISNIPVNEGNMRIDADIPDHWNIDSLNVYFHQKDGTTAVFSNIGNAKRQEIEAYRICEDFFDWVEASETPLCVVEIGSRARSGNVRRQRISERHQYTGVDIKKGPNVDRVADVHELSNDLAPGSLDAVFGLEIFEHLAMPWKVALELNKVLKTGGRAMFFTVQAWPLHEEPFDFFRFSKEAWYSLFNDYTGFRVLNAAIGDPARLVGDLQTNATNEILHGRGYLVSSVLVEKTSETKLSWEVPAESLYKGEYPA